MTRRGTVAALLALLPWTARAGDDAEIVKKCKREGAEFCRELSVGESQCRKQWYKCCEKNSAKARRRCINDVIDSV